jgi:hypothetical protein
MFSFSLFVGEGVNLGRRAKLAEGKRTPSWNRVFGSFLQNALFQTEIDNFGK